jgi:hypothetical protein
MRYGSGGGRRQSAKPTGAKRSPRAPDRRSRERHDRIGPGPDPRTWPLLSSGLSLKPTVGECSPCHEPSPKVLDGQLDGVISRVGMTVGGRLEVLLRGSLRQEPSRPMLLFVPVERVERSEPRSTGLGLRMFLPAAAGPSGHQRATPELRPAASKRRRSYRVRGSDAGSCEPHDSCSNPRPFGGVFFSP